MLVTNNVSGVKQLVVRKHSTAGVLDYSLDTGKALTIKGTSKYEVTGNFRSNLTVDGTAAVLRLMVKIKR